MLRIRKEMIDIDVDSGKCELERLFLFPILYFVLLAWM